MKIKQIGEFNGDIIETILKNRNIENLERFLNPDNSDNLDAFKLKNMRFAAETLLAHVVADSEIGLLVDPDADGFTSASVVYQTIKLLNHDAKINYFLHDSKAHGLTEKIMEQIAKSNISLLVVPDAGSNDIESIARIFHMGIEILIIDHHEVEKVPEHAIIVNNQLPDNEATNKNLVGAGMALKFCEAMDHYLKEKISDKFFELVAIGQIGDSSDISQNEVRNLVFKGMKNINNQFVRTVLADKFEDVDSLAPKDLSFSIIPLINSVVRVGTMEEKDLLFRALNNIDAEGIYEIPKKKKNKVTGKFDTIIVQMDFYEYVYDICKKVKSRQDAMVKKIMANVDKTLDNTGGIIVAVIESTEAGSVTGLVANKITRKYQKPALLVHKVEGKYVGSGRGWEKTLASLKDWCNETGLVEFAQGHANAFGISIFDKDFEKFKETARNVEAQEFIYEVDLLTDKVDKDLIVEVDKHKYLFGGKVHEALFAYENIPINKSFIRQKGSMLTFFEKGVEFVMYSAPDGLYESLTNNFDRFIPMTFVGRPTINFWNGRKTIQVVLEDCERYESKESEESEKEEVTAETIVF